MDMQALEMDVSKRLIERASEENLLMLTDKNDLPIELRLSTMPITFINDLARGKDFPCIDPYTVNRPLLDFFDVQSAANPEATEGVRSTDVTVNEEKGTWVRIFSHPQAEESVPLPVVLFYHGGGFAFATPASIGYDAFCTRLAEKSKCIVVSGHYRRSPEYKYPIAHEDSFQILQWLKTTTELPRNADLSRCFLMGDSSGGNLVHFTAYRAATQDAAAARGLAPISIKGHVLIQPYFGGEERTPAEKRLKHVPILSEECSDWCWKAYLGIAEDRNHPVCNVFGPRSDNTLTERYRPPSLVIVGEYDILQDWQMRYAHALEAAGHPVTVKFYKGAIHAFYLFFQFPLADQVLTDICSFIKDNSK